MSDEQQQREERHKAAAKLATDLVSETIAFLTHTDEEGHRERAMAVARARVALIDYLERLA